MSTHHGQPPRLAEWLLRQCLPAGVIGRSIVGDAREEYLEYSQSDSHLPARIWYWIYIMPIIARFLTGKTPTSADQTQPTGGWPTRLGNVATDVRIAIRMLRRKPAFTVAAVLTLGLGIGANTTIFSLVNGVLLRPLPYPDADRLVGVYRIDPEITGPNPSPAVLADLWAVPYAVYEDWRDMSPVFAAAGAHFESSFTMTGDDRPERLTGAVVTSGVFEALRVAPLIGRPLIAADDEVGAPSSAVLSDNLWQRRFGSDPDILDQDIVLNGISYTIVGVMPSGFSFPFGEEDVWVSFDDQRKTSPVRNSGYLQVLARLRPGVNIEQAQLEVDAVARHIGEVHPEESEHGIGLYSFKQLRVADARPALLVLLGAVSLVLLIACANIANLLLVRATERRRELGVRQALGAGRARLLLQQLSESVVLALAGGLAGYAIAVASLRPFVAVYPGGLARAEEIVVDYRMLLIAATLSVATGLVIGALPALRAVRVPIVAVLQDGTRGFAGGRHRSRTQATLVVCEIALAFVLLVGAGLFVRSFTRLLSVDRGFVSDSVIVMPVSLPEQYRQSSEESAVFYQELVERIRAVPGVRMVGGANQMPFMGGMSFPPTSVETSEGVDEDIVHSTTVTPEYFPALNIPLVAGRLPDADDLGGTEPVVVVSEAMVRRYWADEEPIGQRVRRDFPGDSIWRTVVGVVGDVRTRLNEAPYSQFYIPYAQNPVWFQTIVIKTAVPATTVMPQVREALWVMSRDLPARLWTLDELISQSAAVAGPRFGIYVLGSLSALAALLAILGIYGVLAYTVSQRSREIGIRMALGAGANKVVRAVLGRGLLMTGGGLLIGLGIAVAGGRVIRSLLFEISPGDPLTIVAVAALVTMAAILASYVPARRATKVDPAAALRQE